MTNPVFSRPSVNLRPEHPTAKKMLDVTVQMIDAQGEVSVRVQDVVAAAGVQIPVLYRHFGNREGLIQAAHVQRLLNEFDGFVNLGRESAAAADSREALMARFASVVDDLFGPERAPTRFKRLNIVGSSYGRPGLQAAVVEIQNEAAAMLVALLEPAQAIGWISESVDLEAYVRWLSGLTMSQAIIDLSGDDAAIAKCAEISRKAALSALFDAN
ncbi:AcrR Transcriptional regulator [Acidimicrobiia bacterium]